MKKPPTTRPPVSSPMLSNLQKLHQKYERFVPALAFLGGFIFDVLTLSAIDDVWSLIQQGVYLGFCLVLLGFEFWEKERQIYCPSWLQKVWPYRTDALHFLLGSLLSMYTLFYFKSTALLSAWAFVFLMMLILVANEMPQFRKYGTPLRVGLFSLCLVSFFLIVVPILVGHVGPWTFVLTLSLSLLVFRIIYKAFVKNLRINLVEAKRSLRRPYMIVCFSIAALYFLKLLPPLPLSVTFAGMYYDIEKSGPNYSLYYSKPAWKFWQKSSTTVYANPGEKIYCFAQVFSPARFQEQLNFRWLRKNPKTSKWEQWDLIPMQIVGGRKHGFRGYTTKNNFSEGEWRIQIESGDGREVSRLYFELLHQPRPNNLEKLDIL